MSETLKRIWYFVRHGQTEWNAERRMQGQWDSNLTELGKGHADVNGQWLAKQPIDIVYASPLGRVKQTCEIIATHFQMASTPIWDDRLMEWSSGDWSGKLYTDIQIERPDEFKAWEADRYHYRPPNAENFIDLENRADSFIADARATNAHAICVIAHGFINRVMVGRLAGLGYQDVLTIHQKNDIIIRVTETETSSILDHYIAGAGPIDGPPIGLPGAG